MLKEYVSRTDSETVDGNTCETNVANNMEKETGVLLADLSESQFTDLGPSVSDTESSFQLDHLEPEYKAQIERLLSKYTDIFDDRPGKTTLCTHSIQLFPETKPFRLSPHKVNPEKQPHKKIGRLDDTSGCY